MLDEVLWKDRDHIGIDELWRMLCQYCYLPRLKDRDVLMNAIRAGLATDEYFAYAEGYHEGRYMGLRIGQMFPDIIESRLLVKPGVAKPLLEEKPVEPFGPVDEGDKGTEDTGATGGEARAPIISKAKAKRFYASFRADSVRMNRDAGTIFKEIVSVLSEVKGADIEITIDIKAMLPEGIDASIERVVKENGRTLGATSIGIEETD